MGIDDTNTSLGLDLGLRLASHLEDQETFLKLDHQRNKKKSPFYKNDHPQYFSPSLTLDPSVDRTDHQSRGNASIHSDTSSFSNTSEKKEREFCCEEIEVERVISSPRVSCEDEEGSPRKKLRLSKEQSAILEDSFKEHSTLNPKLKQVLANRLNLKPRQVEVWFQNRRARTKLKQTEVDCEILKKCCEKLTEENKRLLKEVQELKSLKMTAAQYFMKLPAATLTMCPSCERVVAGGGGDVGTPPSRTLTIGKKSNFCDPFTSHHPSAAC